MINAMATICPICEEGKLEEVKKKTLLEFYNPGQVVIEAKIHLASKLPRFLTVASNLKM